MIKSLIGLLIGFTGVFTWFFAPIALSIYFFNGWFLLSYFVSWIPGMFIVAVANAILEN